MCMCRLVTKQLCINAEFPVWYLDKSEVVCSHMNRSRTNWTNEKRALINMAQYYVLICTPVSMRLSETASVQIALVKSVISRGTLCYYSETQTNSKVFGSAFAHTLQRDWYWAQQAPPTTVSCPTSLTQIYIIVLSWQLIIKQSKFHKCSNMRINIRIFHVLFALLIRAPSLTGRSVETGTGAGLRWTTSRGSMYVPVASRVQKRI